MKRTQQVTIGRIAFFVDEDAYQRLQSYLEGIENYYSDNADDGQEILTDIEARIAEVLQERVTDTNQSVTLTDITAVLDLLGEPEQFDEPSEQPSFNHKKNKTMRHRRIFRSSDERILGGVCSGLASFIGIKALYVRIAFAFLTIFGGTSIVAYALLWFLVPEARTETERIEMQGTPINIGEIESNVKDTISDIREKFRK